MPHSRANAWWQIPGGVAKTCCSILFSGKFLLVASGILGLRIYNPGQAYPNPVNYRNPDFKFHWQGIRFESSYCGTRNSKRGIQNHLRLSWIIFGGSSATQWNYYTFLIICPPTPPLSQHFTLCEKYNRLPITRTFKGNRKKFELSGIRRK